MTTAPNSEYYRRKAEECEHLAEELTVPAFKERYLELAHNWRVLAGKAEIRAPRDQATDLSDSALKLAERIAASPYRRNDR
jgi:hypothetical protein